MHQQIFESHPIEIERWRQMATDGDNYNHQYSLQITSIFSGYPAIRRSRYRIVLVPFFSGSGAVQKTISGRI